MVKIFKTECGSFFPWSAVKQMYWSKDSGQVMVEMDHHFDMAIPNISLEAALSLWDQALS